MSGAVGILAFRLLDATLDGGLVERISEWKPVINPAISYALDSQLMEGTTYLERSALGVSLDSGPTEGASCLEPLEQWVFSSSLAARPVAGVAEKGLDTTGLGQYPGRSTYGGDYLPGAFGSGGVSGQWTNGRDVVCGTIRAISARRMLGHVTGRDRHARPSGSGITDGSQTDMFEIVGTADAGYGCGS